MKSCNRTGALAVLTAAAMIAAIPNSSEAESTHIALVERAAADAITDIGAEGDSAGDLLTFANEIYDAANEKQVGTDNGWCIRTVPGKAWECFWTLSLSGGQITVAGPFLDAGDSVLAVTGGTGEYAGARGSMKLHARNDKGTEYDFIYEIEK